MQDNKHKNVRLIRHNASVKLFAVKEGSMTNVMRLTKTEWDIMRIALRRFFF